MTIDRPSLLARLRLMLTYCRPMGSTAERTFINRFIRPRGARPDVHGNWIRTIGTRPRVLWSCHTDTVHARAGRQHVIDHADDRFGLTREMGFGLTPRFGLTPNSRSTCLGADDTAGIFILCEMIDRGIEGQYVFHYGEERGCLGSSALVADRPAWLEGIEIAIALDRKGTTDVITHQGARTASDQFASELAAAIGLGYAPSDRGIYTDTERYAGLVPECTNLSIGYEHAHSPQETLDADHVLALLERLSAIDLATIGVYRDPTAPDPDDVWQDDWRYDDFGRQGVREGQYLDPAFEAVTRFDQRNLWDRPDGETERQERLQRELEAWFREIGRQSRYTK